MNNPTRSLARLALATALTAAGTAAAHDDSGAHH